MKIKLLKSVLFLVLLSVVIISCEEDSDSAKDSLYVKFINSSGSEFTITGIQLLDMGVAGSLDEPTGSFGNNILDAGQTIAPGEFLFFDLDIPSSHYAYYRLTVDDGTGQHVFLHSQTGYENSYDGTITHWGGDDRTVEVRVVWNDIEELIYVQMWSDWVGID